jgi:hypothetical protein
MARKTKVVVITGDEDNRDLHKRFLLTEMPASQAEKWAMRAFLALTRSGLEIPANIKEAGFAGLAIMGLQALSQISFQEAEPLMDEMFSCVQVMPDARNPQVVRPLLESDIEEVTTRIHLRQEVLQLHVSFFKPGVSQTTGSTPMSRTSLAS